MKILPPLPILIRDLWVVWMTEKQNTYTRTYITVPTACDAKDGSHNPSSRKPKVPISGSAEGCFIHDLQVYMNADLCAKLLIRASAMRI